VVERGHRCDPRLEQAVDETVQALPPILEHLGRAAGPQPAVSAAAQGDEQGEEQGEEQSEEQVDR
jgi:hypothetical protein